MTRPLWHLAWLAMLALGFAAAPRPANATVRALFVGVDTYRWSTWKNVPQFDNLKGAVGDVRRIKIALEARYNWPLDKEIAGQCPSKNDVSTTLINECAGRDAIVAALRDLIARSSPGDTVLFYFAGHGSQVHNIDRTQKSGRNDTILPYDARDLTAGKPPNEILDVELNAWIENARNQGMNVVTIFDSCHSRTGTRAGRTGVLRIGRRVPEGVVVTTRPIDRIIPPRPGSSRGYRVHLAAALDQEQAAEVALQSSTPPAAPAVSDAVTAIGPRPGDTGKSDDERAGTFTSALVAAIERRQDTTFADLIADVQQNVRDETQHPQAEAQPSVALEATFEGRTPTAPVFTAKRDGSVITLGAGRIAVVTKDSTYGLFDDRKIALDNAATPLATAKVSAVDFDTATLALDATTTTLPDKPLFARELVHAYGVNRVPVTIALLDKNTALEAQLRAAVAPLQFASLASDSRLLIQNDVPPNASHLYMVERGQQLADLGNADPPLFASRLATVLKAMARVEDILALRDGSPEPALSLCVDDRPYNAITHVECPSQTGSASANTGFTKTRCTVKRPGQHHPTLKCPSRTKSANARGSWTMRVIKHVIPATSEVKLAVTNKADVARYVYVLMIENRQEVTLLTPEDAPLRDHRTQVVVFTVSNPGTKQFLVLASEKPIPAGLLEQDGARDAASCSGQLERLLCTAGSGGVRDPTIAHTEPWAAIISTVEFR